MDKLMITIAPNGESRTKKDNPHVPLTVEEVIEDVVACYEAGASIAHLHGRVPETGAISFAPDYYCRIVEGVRKRCDIVINISTGGTTDDPFERLGSFAARPETCSLSGGSVNFTGKAFVNHPDVILEFARRMYENGIKPNIECFDYSHIVWAKRIAESGRYIGPLSVDILMEKPGNVPFTPHDLLFYVEALPKGAIWNTVGDKMAQLHMAAMAIIMGGHVRVGIEDNNEYMPGQLATNVQLVERVARLSRELGREIATPDEARAMLGISKPN